MRRFSKNKFCYYPAGSRFYDDPRFTSKKLSKEFGFKVYLGLTLCMKGGHTHNHIYNKLHKHIFRGRNARKSVSRKDKPEFVKTAYLNIKLGNVTWDSLIHTIFHHNKKEKK